MIRSPPPINIAADASVDIGESKLDDDEYDCYNQHHHHLNQIMSNSTNITSGSTSSMKPPPQPATAAVNSIHWDVEEGV